jgi:hypothetical protein
MSFLPVDITISFRAADRGLYLLLGKVDVLAPSLQILRTPNGTPISIAATQGDSYPRRWSIEKILENAPEGTADFSETEKRIAADGVQTDLLTLTGNDNVSMLETFTSGVVSDVKSLGAMVQKNVYIAIGAVVVVLVLVLVIRSK